jgi:hypothetical protein
LDDAYESLRGVASSLNGLEIRVERGGLVAPKIGDSLLPDAKGELQALGKELQRVGIYALAFAREFHVGELDTLAQLVKATLLTSEENVKRGAGARWPELLAENRVEGILVNTQTERRVDSVLASLIAALVAYGGHSERENSSSAIQAPQIDDLMAALSLLSRLTPPLESARGLSPEEAARAIHGAMEEASRDTVRLLLSCVSQYAPREGELPQPYLLRLSESLIFEFLGPEFSAGALTATGVRPMLHRLGGVLVNAGKYAGPHASAHLSSFAMTWSTETYREKLVEKFWVELPQREKSTVLRGPEVWCVPIVALRQTLAQLAEAGADAPRREARSIVLNYARRIENEDAGARRSVAAGLDELTAVIESLWPNQLPEDLSSGTLKALERETVPETAALLAAFRVGTGAERSRARSHGGAGTTIGCAGSLAAAGGCCACESGAGSGFAAIVTTGSGTAAGTHDIGLERAERRRAVAGDVAAAADDWRTGAEHVRSAAVRFAEAARQRCDQTARGD